MRSEEDMVSLCSVFDLFAFAFKRFVLLLCCFAHEKIYQKSTFLHKRLIDFYNTILVKIYNFIQNSTS